MTTAPAATRPMHAVVVRAGAANIRVLLWLAVGAYAAGFSALSVLRHRAFSSGRFDLGNMVQAVWSTAHGHPLQITDLRGRQISRLGAHFDPILAVWAPFWRLWPSPSLLLATQAVVVALGAIPAFWLARRALGSERAALGFALAYLLYPPVQWLALDDFHAVALAPTLLLFAIWYLVEDRLVPFAAFAVLAVTTREEVGLAVAALGIAYAFSRRRWRAGAAIAAAGALVTVLAVTVVIPHFSPEGRLDFYPRYSEAGGSPSGILHTAVTDPGRLVTVIFDHRGLTYLFQLLLPLAGLSVFAPFMLLAAAPQLALNLLADTPTQTSVRFHYTGAVIPGIVAASILGAGRLARRRVGLGETISLIVVLCALAANYRLGALPLWRYVPGGEKTAPRAADVSGHDAVAARALRLVPPQAAVSASNTLGAHLSARRRILSFPVLTGTRWIAVDTTRPSYLDHASAPERFEQALGRIRRSGRWHTVYSRDGVLLLRHHR